MAWIEAHDSLLNHRKIARLARILGITKVTARGHMLTLWLNVLGQSPDGLFLSWDSPEIAEAAEWTGDAQVFVDAAVQSGLIDTNDQYECLQLHDWMDYAGSLKAAKQKRLQRERAKVSTDSPKTVPGPSPECPVGPTDRPTDQTNTTSDLFDRFWKSYPRKTAKDAARKAFQKRKVTEDLLGKMLEAIATQKTTEQWTKDGGKFIPHPATWLNAGRWQDEPTQVAKPTEFNFDLVTHPATEAEERELCERMGWPYP